MELSGAAQQALVAYDWPGNVRELENAIRKLLAFGEESALLESHSWEPEEGSPLTDLDMEEDPTIWSLKEVARLAAREAERELLLRALQRTNWNRRRAAELVKISYKAMLYKLKVAGLAKRSRAAYSA